MPTQSKFGNFPCEKQEQKSANLISCEMLSAVTAGKKTGQADHPAYERKLPGASWQH